MENTSIFHKLLFDFEISRFITECYLFKLKHQKPLSRISLKKVVKKVVLKIGNFLQNVRGIFQIYSLRSVLVLHIRK